jgi:hypothetical protein
LGEDFGIFPDIWVIGQYPSVPPQLREESLQGPQAPPERGDFQGKEPAIGQGFQALRAATSEMEGRRGVDERGQGGDGLSPMAGPAFGDARAAMAEVALSPHAHLPLEVFLGKDVAGGPGIKGPEALILVDQLEPVGGLWLDVEITVMAVALEEQCVQPL